MPILFHVSDRAGIERFEPRLPTGAAAGTQPLVWAVDSAHLAHYLLPRDCPRVAFAAAPIDALLASGAELRVMPSLVALAAAVAGSTLAFSCIRMRNARVDPVEVQR